MNHLLEDNSKTSHKLSLLTDGTHLHQAVVSVCPLVGARQSLEPRVLRQAERHAVLGPELLELSHHAVGDARDGLRQQAVHHGLDDVELVLTIDTQNKTQVEGGGGRTIRGPLDG